MTVINMREGHTRECVYLSTRLKLTEKLRNHKFWKEFVDSPNLIVFNKFNLIS